MSEYIDERIVSIKFDNSGFEQKVSETQKSLDGLNKSLEFDGAEKGAEELSKAFKEISTEAKNTDLKPLSDSVENVKSKFSVLETVAVGALIKIGSQAVELGEKLIKSITIDPIAQGFEKYQDILTSQMTLTAALGGDTEEEIAANAALIEDTLEELTWYADETSYSLEDMIKNVSQFANYGVDLDDAKTAMMGIANASAKSGAPLALASHAMEGFSKAMGQGYMTFQVWRSWLNTSHITTLDFKNTFIETAKEMIKQGAVLSDKVRLVGDSLEYYAGKNQGWLEITAENIENSLTKGQWLTSDVMLAGLAKYSASMDDLYEATNHGTEAVSTLLETSEEGFDKFSLQAFLYAQQCKTLNDVVDALFDATSTTWYRMFKSLIGDYKQTVDLWSNFAEYLFEWFVYPLQEVAAAIDEFSKSTSKTIKNANGEFMTMREVIVDSFMNIMEAITSVINPIKEAFNAVFNPLEEIPNKLQNGVEKFHSFTESLILTEEKAVKLRNTFIAVFSVLQKIWNIISIIINAIKKIVKPIIETVGKLVIKILSTIGTYFVRIASFISSTISNLFGVSDFVADIKDTIQETAEAIEELKNAENEKTNFLDEYKTHKDYIDKYSDSVGNATEALEELEEEEKKVASNPNIITGGYTGESFLSYYQAIEEANNKVLAEFIKENKITEEQYTAFINLMDAREKGYKVYYDDFVKILDNNEELANKLTKIINDSMAAYIATAKAIEGIKDREFGKEVQEYETVLDGIYYAQQRTLVKQGELNKLVDLYFNKNIKDTAKLAEEVGIEEWKVRELVSAYKEAYAVENYLNKNRLKATTENIKLARVELGYIEEKASEDGKYYKTAREQAAALRRETAERRREELIAQKTAANKQFTPSKDVADQISKSTAAINGYNDVTDSTTKSIEKIGDATTKSFNVIKDSIDTIKDKIKDLAPDIGKSIDKISPVVEDKVTNLMDVIKSKLNISSEIGTQVQSSTLEIEKSEKSISDTSNKTSKKVEEDNKNIEKSFENVAKQSTATSKKVIKDSKKTEKEVEKQTEKLEKDVDNTLDFSLDFEFDNVSEKSSKLFEVFNYIKDFFAFTDFSSFKNKILEAGSYIKDFFVFTDFASIKSDLQLVFDYTKKIIFNFIKKTSSEIKEKGLKEYFKPVIEAFKNADFLKDAFGILKNKIDELWNTFKNYTKSKVNEIRNDEENPFYWVIYAFDRLNEWFDSFRNTLKDKIKTVNSFFKALFSKDSFSEKMGNSSIFGPIFDLISSVLTKFDELYRGIKNFKNLIKEELDNVESNLHNSVNKIKSDLDDIKKAWDIFIEDIETVRAFLNGDKEKEERAKEAGGIAGLIGKILHKWDELKEKTKDGLDWETIVKVDELERILERLIKAISDAYLKIAFGSIAFEIGRVFGALAKGLDTLFASIGKKKDIGKVLIEIALAIAILAASFYELGQMDAGAIKQATSALAVLATTLQSMMSIVMVFLYKMQGKELNRKNRQVTLSNGLTGVLESVFGRKNTMTQAGKLILGIAAGIWAMTKAFSTLADVVKTYSPEEIEATIDILIRLSVIFLLLFFAIEWIINKFNGKGESSNGKFSIGKIKVVRKDIEKTTTPLADVLKSFAIMMGVLIAGFAAISFIIDKFLTKDGEINNTKFAAVLAVLLGMMGVTFAAMALMTRSIKQIKDIDNKTIKSFSKMLTPFAASLFLMIVSFDKIIKVLDSVQNPKTFSRSVGVFAGIFLGIILFMSMVVLLCKYLTGETSSTFLESNKDFKGMQSGSGMALLGKQSGKFMQVNKTQTGDLSQILSTASKMIIALGWGVKIIAQAFSTIVTTIDGIQNDGTFGKAVGVFIGIFAGVVLLIIALIAAAHYVQPENIEMIKAIGLAILEVAFSAVMIGIAIKMLATTFADIYKAGGEKGEELINKAILTITLFIGGILALFTILSVLAATGVGGFAAGAATTMLDAIAVAILMIATAVLVFAKGLETLVNVLIKVSSANDSIEKGLDGLIALMPKVKTLIVETISSIISGIVLGVRKAKTDIAIGMIEILSSLVEAVIKYGPGIINGLTKAEELDNAVHKFFDKVRNFIWEELIAVIDFLTDHMEDLREPLTNFFYSLGQLISELVIEVPVALAAGFVDGLYNLFGLNKDGEVKSKDDEDSVYQMGVNVIKGLIKGMLEAIAGVVGGLGIKEAASQAWKTFKESFTSKENSDQASPSKAAFKLGAYVGEGLVNGIESSAKAVSDSASVLNDAFMDPMEKNMKSFNAITSSMFAQLIDADMDFNPVITPVFDMSNLDYAAASMDRLFASQDAIEVATSFNTMKLSKEMEKLNQNVGKTDTPAEPTTYNYVQNNYSPKALSPIEIYRRTHNQLTVAKNLAYGDKEGWVLSK